MTDKYKKEFDVSVVVTLYNYANYIEDCIKSFLKQDLINSEMVIVDDCSTDNPYLVIKTFISDRVKYIKLDKNQGYSHAKNVGIKNSKSEVICMLDADDMFFGEKSLSCRFKKLTDGFSFVHGPALDFKNGKTSTSPMWKSWIKNKRYKDIHAQTTMFLKKINREIGLFDETLRQKADKEFKARVFNNGYKIGTVDAAVALYRHHQKQMHQSKEKALINVALEELVQKKIETRKNKDFSGLEMLA